jgi:hypothetical protein
MSIKGPSACRSRVRRQTNRLCRSQVWWRFSADIPTATAAAGPFKHGPHKRKQDRRRAYCEQNARVRSWFPSITASNTGICCYIRSTFARKSRHTWICVAIVGKMTTKQESAPDINHGGQTNATLMCTFTYPQSPYPRHLARLSDGAWSMRYLRPELPGVIDGGGAPVDSAWWLGKVQGATVGATPSDGTTAMPPP